MGTLSHTHTHRHEIERGHSACRNLPAGHWFAGDLEYVVLLTHRRWRTAVNIEVVVSNSPGPSDTAARRRTPNSAVTRCVERIDARPFWPGQEVLRRPLVGTYSFFYSRTLTEPVLYVVGKASPRATRWCLKRGSLFA